MFNTCKYVHTSRLMCKEKQAILVCYLPKEIKKILISSKIVKNKDAQP